jgi:serine/threonine protein kinase
VKRIYINAHTFDDKLFRSEVAILININHRNVVQFLGVCSGGYHKLIEDGSGELIWANVLERLLCFKYISNGSLDKYISDELRGLEWEARYEIIIGICKGLRYLHKEKSIVHMDLKPKNILLENQDGKYMVPKITDFGLSRSNKHSNTVGQRYGTLEYMAPEYRDGGKPTQSCDIYSLGLIIIEVVTGCKVVPNKDNVRVISLTL